MAAGTALAALVLAADNPVKDITTGQWILAGAIFVGGILLSFLLRPVARKLVERAGGGETVSLLVGRVVGYLTILFGLFYALSSVNVQIGPLVGALGVGGIAVAFALQAILANLVSGLLLQTRRPFQHGDQIVSNGFEGVVEGVNLRVVTLRTFDGEHVMIPNSMVLENPITNWTRTPTRRTTLMVGVGYDTDLAEAQRLLVDAAESIEHVEADPRAQAFVEEFGASSINFALRFWHKAEILDMWTARDAVAQACKVALDGAGIDMPFPQTTLWFGPNNTELAARIVGEGGRAERGSNGSD